MCMLRRIRAWPSRAWRRDGRDKSVASSPVSMRATLRVILRVTKVSPRIGLSWLKQDSVRGIDAVSLAIVHRDPVAVKFSRRRRASADRTAWSPSAALPGRDRTIPRSTPDRTASPFPCRGYPDRLQQAQHADRIGIGGVFRAFEADRNMTLGGEVVDLGGTDLLHQADQIWSNPSCRHNAIRNGTLPSWGSL